MRVILIGLLILAAAALIYLYGIAPQKNAADEPTGPVQTETTPVEQDTPPVEPQSLPRFDIVRVDRTGFAVVAGQATPGATVELLANGDVIASEIAGRDGAWAINTETPLSQGPVELKLRMTSPDGMTITGDETVIVYVPESDGDQPVVLRTTAGGATEVLQRASDPGGALGPLSIDAIDYDSAGNVILSGRAEPRSVVQVFIDRNPVGQTSTDDNGRWELSATVRPGRYLLQIIQLDENGLPAYAVEVPFEQATKDDILLADGNVIVQPGNNLWVISRRVYGAGTQYTVIYAANADQIRDPDLIYPGQVFRLPESGEETP
ncbi:MAG: LysM peptidoglycan-binding domain-containing protein [Parvularcula sp.]